MLSNDPRGRPILLMALLIATLLVCLPGCALFERRVTTVKMLPPVELTQDCPSPDGKPKTNGDLARYAQDLKGSLALCNNDKAALRAWAEGTK